MTFGWTWEYVDETMTLPRYRDITGYWKYNPPIHVMIARYFDIKPKSADKNMDTTPQAAQEFAQFFGADLDALIAAAEHKEQA